MVSNLGEDLSWEEIYANVESLAVERSGLGLYFNLLRVGMSVIFASFGSAVIVFLLFVPSFPFLPFGRFTQVGLGFVTSIVAFKLYNFFQLSNDTVLNAGRDPERENIVERNISAVFRR